MSIISAKAGSLPPASAGFMYRMSPVSHMASTIGAVRVRAFSDAAAWSVTTSAMAATRSVLLSSRTVMPASLAHTCDPCPTGQPSICDRISNITPGSSGVAPPDPRSPHL